MLHEIFARATKMEKVNNALKRSDKIFNNAPHIVDKPLAPRSILRFCNRSVIARSSSDAATLIRCHC